MNKTDLKSDLFIKACFRQPVERTPVWMMRQAGRYLPEYREIRKKHDFITMYKTPELAAEVTLQPVELVGVDAAILFSDILVIPEAMGMELRFLEGTGPVFPEPLRDESHVQGLKNIDANRDLRFVMDAIGLCRGELNGKVPLIGFSGAPWTLATYMIEGRGSKNFANVKRWRYANPAALHRLLDKIAAAVTEYISAQIDSGAQAIQLFDSWAGILDPEGFGEFALEYSKKIISAVRREGVPVIYFPKGAGIWLDSLNDCGAGVIGLDWTIDLADARKRLGQNLVLQGNLDPAVLLTDPGTIQRYVVQILEKYGEGTGHIFNLGHGILPNTPVENAKAFVNSVKEESPRFHPESGGL